VKRGLVGLGAALVLTLALIAVRIAGHRDAMMVLCPPTSWHDQVCAGSIAFPRGGPYILGFDAPGAAVRLFIDGHEVVHGQGRQSARLIYVPGVHDLRLEGAADVRLLWHPPGRRGPLERVPASSVSPQPKGSAHFGSDAGASRRDAAIASLIVLIWLALAIYLLRPRLDKQRALLYGGIFVLAVAARAGGISSAGQTWDEDEYWCAGKNYVENVLALDFHDRDWRDNFEHPPLTKYVAGVGALWQDGFGVAHLLFILMSALTCVLAAAVTWRLFSPRAALFAGMITALTPHLIGHARVVGHETPSTFLWALAVWLALRTFDDDRRIARLAWVGVAVGLGLATRYSNFLMAPCLAVVFLTMTPPGHRLRQLGTAFVIPAATATLTFFALWPRLWTHPLLHLHQAYDKITRAIHPPENYLGHQLAHPPPSYFIVYALAVTPVLILVLGLVVGPGTGLRKRLRPQDQQTPPIPHGWLIVGAWILAPLGMMWSPVRQDGVRYVLPMLVPLGIAAALGLDNLVALWRHRLVAPLATAVLGAYLFIVCARIAPYDLDYFNEVVGGPAGAQRKHLFEVGWWGEGIGEAVDFINVHAGAGQSLFRLLSPNHVNWFRADLFAHEARDPARADWLVVNDAGIFVNDVLLHAPPFTLPADAVLMHDVQAQGASLVRVYRREAP
jgi:4-amino-4-deoxy-L-arabinose transferase-like glycosyltransferase